MTRILTAVLLTLGLAVAGDPAGAKDAINAAVEKAVQEAVDQALASLPENIDSFAVLPLADDQDGLVTDRVRHFAVQVTKGRAKVVVRSDEEWKKLLKEHEFSEKRFDIMPKEELQKFGKILGADALLYGKVRQRGLDESGIKGQASLTLYLGVVETGQVAGSGSGSAVVMIEAETFFLAMLSKPWFWPVVVIAVVGFLVFILIWIPLRRKLALAAKPREVTR